MFMNQSNETANQNLAETKVETENKDETVENQKESNAVTEILNDMGDHDVFSWGPIHADILPVILYDEGQFHFYGNRQSMEDSGDYITEHHHIVNANTHEAPDLNLSVTNMVAFQWISMIILAIVMFTVSKKAKKSNNSAPKGIHNVIESIIVFIRDDVVSPNIAGKAADRLLPYFFVLFLFILVMNLLGLLPGGHTATATVGVTAALAITAFIVINYTAIRESGIKAWLHHLLGGAPVWLAPLMVPIEIASMFIKPFSLTIRLFANMVAGHTVLFSLIGLLFLFQEIFLAVPIVGFATFINLLELLVAFLQAYIFTMLTAIFVGLAVGEHSHDEEHAH
ncbi:MAG: F0F1 ATP synthase subunit A [Chlorobiota bacterium]